MGLKKQIGINITAFLLLQALMLPTVIKFAHIFENHEHVICTEKSVHIHESETDCSLCSFCIASLNYNILEYPDLSQLEIYVNNKVHFTSLQFYSFKITSGWLRGPPVLS